MYSIESSISNNKVVIESLKNTSVNADEEKCIIRNNRRSRVSKRNNEEIMKLLNTKAIEEFRNGK